MTLLDPVTIQCPYCWESIEVLVDCSVEQQSYVEDCSVCCRPIHLEVVLDSAGEPIVEAFSEEE